MKNNRLMVIKYVCDEDLIEKFKTCMDMCCIKYVIFKEYEVANSQYGKYLYRIYIDKNKCTWNQVMNEVNRVRATKFEYVNDREIIDGKIHMKMAFI